ncbi:hypothetical protein [Actinokineospora iranica]|uniref:Anti-sigma-M factor RsmA n=1 Tax=Actinokineospora iranica TaxID=1271860 RepID=A0A1G6PLG5_9PSEU|nr:hypothetical protein [Actinokineospora iranica]SDC80464.1 hypothetical protein SAMN05216174_104339 [Actinokineospora iranica]
MTDEVRGGGPGRPPWSVDLLADLHAGVLDPEQSARLWPQVNADPDAKAVIDALESVRVGLGELRDAPAPPMPARFAASLDAALEAEARRAFGGGVAVQQLPGPPAQPAPQAFAAPVVDLAEARRKRGKRAAWGVGLLTAAAAAVAVTVAVVPGPKQTTGGVAAPAPSASAPASAPGSAADQGPLAVTRDGVSAAAKAIGESKDYGQLGDEAGLDRCLTANGFDAAKAQTVGVRPVTLDGKPGVMALLFTGVAGQLRVLVVAPDCTQLFNDTIGR